MSAAQNTFEGAFMQHFHKLIIPSPQRPSCHLEKIILRAIF
jgi:hypothetical protein